MPIQRQLHVRSQGSDTQSQRPLQKASSDPHGHRTSGCPYSTAYLPSLLRQWQDGLEPHSGTVSHHFLQEHSALWDPPLTKHLGSHWTDEDISSPGISSHPSLAVALDKSQDGRTAACDCTAGGQQFQPLLYAPCVHMIYAYAYTCMKVCTHGKTTGRHQESSISLHYRERRSPEGLKPAENMLC